MLYEKIITIKSRKEIILKNDETYELDSEL